MRFRALLAALSLLLLAAAPAHAAATISVDQSAPALGTVVTFTVSGVPNNVKHPRVEVKAIQATCAAGYTCVPAGAEFVTYAETGSLAQATCDGTDPLGYCGFTLGGGGSAWLAQGGSARIVATLYYFGKDHGNEVFVPLASSTFSAVG